ncbi:UDP-glucose 4-epimerase GalE [Sulfitobacter sabulilitoris]|uniref:UDP-glucose 4-epimerase n=1 Tax=Sulfitobacter sabulilitoris TaxID=2562655 RepID=A0A5S3PK44_9RHOB|nr:UDP-glucose 4-epimerase GalE [Sulfitobacter sabulilitoris]TMM54779.1 UDP-glucose 4-epimerase GalE [Sulfitobacter sabulilitoris]
MTRTAITVGVPRICVTGGAGYIGSHVCKALSARGHVPLTLDNLSTGTRQNVSWGPLAQVDLRDGTAVARTLRAHQITTVLHFAASAYVGESVTDPGKYYDNNVGGMIALLRACGMTGVRQVIFSSSCATYGIPDQCPVTEDSVQRPINPYGRSKLMCEDILTDMAGQYGFGFAMLRYFNVAGADPDGQLRERHTPETHLIPLALMTAAGQRGEMQIFGNDYDTPDGTCIRDYIHVSDLAQGHLQALSYLDQGGAPLAVNLGSGQGYSNLEVLRAVSRATGRPVPTRMMPRRRGDPPVLVADAGLARAILGFAPRRSDLATIVGDAARSFGLERAHAHSS